MEEEKTITILTQRHLGELIFTNHFDHNMGSYEDRSSLLKKNSYKQELYAEEQEQSSSMPSNFGFLKEAYSPNKNNYLKKKKNLLNINIQEGSNKKQSFVLSQSSANQYDHRSDIDEKVIVEKAVHKRESKSSDSFTKLLIYSREPGHSMFDNITLGRKKQYQASNSKRSKKKRKMYLLKQDHLLQNNTVESDQHLRKKNLLKDILENPIPILTKSQKKSLYILWKQNVQISGNERRMLWLRASGAENQISLSHNKGYYMQLLNFTMDYPNLCFNQIELDLTRTFQEFNDSEQRILIPSLRNVLTTYVKRNPTVGYCQGMNFIVGRLLQYMNEEESFWVLSMIIETILPIDYYSNMVGVLIDQQVFKEIVKDVLPDLFDHFEKLQFDPSLLAFQWFVCFFTYNMTKNASLKVWDLFMIKGVKVLFSAGIGLLCALKKQLMDAQDFQTCFQILDQSQKSDIDVPRLLHTMKLSKYQIKNRLINKKRSELRAQKEEELQTMIERKEMNQKGPYPKLQFINKFYLYSGLSKYYEQSEFKWISMEQFEQELMSIFNCSPEWPICLFDFTYKNKIPNYFCFKVEADLTHYIIKNYFNQFGHEISHSKRKNSNLSSDLIIERNKHICTNQVFVKNFKILFNQSHEIIFKNKIFLFKINDEMEAMQQAAEFQNQILSLDFEDMEFEEKSDGLFDHLSRKSTPIKRSTTEHKLLIKHTELKDIVKTMRQSVLVEEVRDINFGIYDQNAGSDSSLVREINYSILNRDILPSLQQSALETIICNAGKHLLLKSGSSSEKNVLKEQLENEQHIRYTGQINGLEQSFLEFEEFEEEKINLNNV